MLKDFKPSILFLVKFVVLYMLLNFLYAYYIKVFDNQPDTFTYWVTANSSSVVDMLGLDTSIEQHVTQPNVGIVYQGTTIVSVFEGCNGLNVMIIFVSFILSFGKPTKAMAWFVPFGLVVIHLSNLLRIALLFFVAKDFPHYMYFTHKYFFTAIIYVVVFVLWFVWITHINVSKNNKFITG